MQHPGVTEDLSSSLCEAARVCLDRYHQPPTVLSVTGGGLTRDHTLQWDVPTQTARNSQRNVADSLRDGAYAVSLVAVERRLSLVAISRADEGTGADWYVAPPGHAYDVAGAPDLDAPGVARLEVSGTGEQNIPSRVASKKRQLRAGRSDLPGLVSVVGFKQRVVRIEAGDGVEA